MRFAAIGLCRSSRLKLGMLHAPHEPYDGEKAFFRANCFVRFRDLTMCTKGVSRKGFQGERAKASSALQDETVKARCVYLIPGLSVSEVDTDTYCPQPRTSFRRHRLSDPMMWHERRQPSQPSSEHLAGHLEPFLLRYEHDRRQELLLLCRKEQDHFVVL